ncbi:RDD family protein [Streptomyces sp. NPDC002851]
MADLQHHQQQNQAYAPPHPYAHPNPYAQPYAQPTPQRPAVPEEVSDERRMLFSTIDGLITIVGGLSLATQLADKTGGSWWIYAAACVFGLSFVHHVLGTWVFRTTVGKFLLVTRVVREVDAGRPRFWQLVGRWLLGLTWLPMQPLRALVWADGDPYEDACGLRYVRSRDLRR